MPGRELPDRPARRLLALGSRRHRRGGRPLVALQTGGAGAADVGFVIVIVGKVIREEEGHNEAGDDRGGTTGHGDQRLAINIAFVSPGTFTLQLSLLLLAGAVVGLFASIWGALAGALLLLYLPDVVGLLPRVDGKQAGPATFFFGLLVVVLMLVLPLVRRLRRAPL